MLNINEVTIPQVLNRTSIDLAEYVVNPFMGCEFSCLYCYVRANKAVSKKKSAWGSYVDVRVNTPESLEKEIIAKKPKSVLLGSTTECFQTVEEKYHLTEKSIEILNRYKVPYVILTRSPYILEYLSLLKEGFCKRVYFTTNNFTLSFKKILEPKSPSFISRDEAIRALLQEGISVIPYFSPVLPGVSEVSGIFNKFKDAKTVECEALNFKLPNISQILSAISSVDSSLKMRYDRMLLDEAYYQETWKKIEGSLCAEAKAAGKKYCLYVNKFQEYFNNTYERV